MSDAADVVKQAAQKYLDDTCSMCDRNTEYIYILPVTPNRDENGNKLSRKDKGTIKDLAQSLSKVKILFDLDKDVPKINESGEHIDKCVDILKSDNNLKVIIEGYTCSLGSEEHNRDLAKRRAESIKRMFVEKGVNPNQIETVSYTANDKENAQNITDPSKEEHRAAIFRIVKR